MLYLSVFCSVDIHGVQSDVYLLRNPSDKPQSLAVDVQNALELPTGSAKTFVGHSPWKEDAHQPEVVLRAGQPHPFQLAPFEVLTLDLRP